MNKYAVAGMVSLALAGIAQAAHAQDPGAKPDGPVSPWYVGAGIGQTFASIPQQTIDGIDSVLTAANGATFSVIDKDKHSAGVKFFVGYSFNRYFAVEGGYEAVFLSGRYVRLALTSATPASTSAAPVI